MVGAPARRRGPRAVITSIVHAIVVLVAAAILTLAFFLVLPLFEAIGAPPQPELIVQAINTTEPPPPPPPEEEEKEKEKPEEEKPPELTEQAPPLDLSQLELALGPSGLSGDWLVGDFGVKLNAVSSTTEDVESLFSMSDLDQKPRAVYQPSPALTAKTRAKAPGTVHVIFVVDPEGRVENPTVQQSSDPIFEAPALAAVRQWKFEPGKRNGQPVRFRMRVPITFPKS